MYYYAVRNTSAEQGLSTVMGGLVFVRSAESFHIEPPVFVCLSDSSSVHAQSNNWRFGNWREKEKKKRQADGQVLSRVLFLNE